MNSSQMKLIVSEVLCERIMDEFISAKTKEEYNPGVEPSEVHLGCWVL